MDEQRPLENRLAWIGLTVLVVGTVLLFSFLFLNAGSLFSGSDGDSDPKNETSEKEPSDSAAVQEQIRALQADMNAYRARLDSPYLTVVSEASPLPSGYQTEVSALLTEGSGFFLETAAAAAFNSFLQAASEAGFTPAIDAAHRTEQEQKKAFEAEVKKNENLEYSSSVAAAMAAVTVGKVNCSEHQLGLAVDFKASCMEQRSPDGKTFREFVNENAHKYGFILSYPVGKENVTDHEADMNHYRYVGVDVAKEMHEKGFTLPEYRDYLTALIASCKEKMETLSPDRDVSSK